MNTTERHDPGRRAFLRRAGLAAGLGATLPLLGSPIGDATTADPDSLFQAGRFAAADRGYRRILHRDPRNAHATAQVGYIALLHNRFPDAEKYLSRAVSLAPEHIATKQRLADCYVRQDQLTRAVPLLGSTGRPRDTAFAELYRHFTSPAWQVHGAQRTRVPFHAIDPLPSFAASVNGADPQPFMIDSYATFGVSKDVAEAAGLRVLAETTGQLGGGIIIKGYLGIMDSLRIGDIEFRNVPVGWGDGTVPMPPLPDGSQPAGMIGTDVFYRLLATMDYANREFVLRRKTGTQLRRFQTESSGPGLERLPLWLAVDHFPGTLGSLRDYGPRLVTLDTGGLARGLDTTVELAELAGIDVDYAHPMDLNGNKHYPIRPDRISLGKAVGHNVRGHAAERAFGPGPGQSEQFGFDIIANFTHEFFYPFAITFDYLNMRFYLSKR